MGFTLDITPEGATALREFADSMSGTVSIIEDDTAKLMAVYSAVSEQLGVHKEDFQTMIDLVSHAQEEAAEAISALVPALNTVADKIDDFVATHPLQ